MSFIVVRHNVEIAHRLYELEGNKCQNIHGHSMWVEMKLHGHLDGKGYMSNPHWPGPVEFGAVKKLFREYLDDNFDHRLLLNEKDPWAQFLKSTEWRDGGYFTVEDKAYEQLPGLHPCKADPTTENIAKWVAEWSVKQFGMPVDVHVQETHVNGAGYSMKGSNGN